MDYSAFSDFLQIILQIANVFILGYALFKFINKPHDSLEAKHNDLAKTVAKHDSRLEDIEESLRMGNDRFRNQEETNSTFKSVMLAFINFAIAYCQSTGYKDNQDLLNAQEELSDFLTGKNRHERY